MTKTRLLRVISVSLSENFLLGLKYYRVVVVKLFKDKVYLHLQGVLEESLFLSKLQS